MFYNYYLEKMKREGYTYAYDNIKDYVSNLKYKSAFLQEIDSIVIRKSIFNLDSVYQKMYKEGKCFSVFKSRFGKNRRCDKIILIVNKLVRRV